MRAKLKYYRKDQQFPTFEDYLKAKKEEDATRVRTQSLIRMRRQPLTGGLVEVSSGGPCGRALCRRWLCVSSGDQQTARGP